MDKTKVKSVNSTNQIDDSNEEIYRIASTLAFIIVIVVIGVPMWWKTTAVYRFDLPYDDINMLNEVPIKAAVKIGIFTFQKQRSDLLLAELQQAFADSEYWNIIFVALPYLAGAKDAKTPAKLETLLLRAAPQETGDFYFIEWPTLKEEVLLTTERTAFVRSDISASRIAAVLDAYILQTQRVHQILHPDSNYNRKSIAPKPEYDLIISVINPKPDVMNVKWHIPMALESYLLPFLSEVSDISNYTVKTQWKYNVAFQADLKQIRDDTKFGRHYALQEASLPHIISSIEKNLGTGISMKTAIHIVIYVTPCDISPVHIYSSNNNMSDRQKVDGFMSPSWGGFIIANPPEDVCLTYNENQEPVEFHIDTNDVMQVMLYQLHRLFDISSEAQVEDVEVVGLEQIAPRRWEYEAYIRRSVITLIETSTNTLQSLIKLLDDISYIVINDNVGNEIVESYEHLLRAKTALANNQLLNATKYAKRAFVTSEHVFFDASLLAQLYFPDEQKYAIYIPLFLPIMVPVITSLTMLRKLWQRFRKSKKTIKTKKLKKM